MPTTYSMVQASIRNEIHFFICEVEILKSGTQEGTGDLKVKENIGQVRHFIQQHTAMPAGTQAHAKTNMQAKVCTNKPSAQKLHRDRHTGLQANVCMHTHTETHTDKHTQWQVCRGEDSYL